MPTSRRATAAPALCVVGVGPRGASLVERLGACARRWGPATPWELHLVDDAEHGSGRVWRTDQPREMCMNTLAAAVTLFPDESVEAAGPVVHGPDLHEWSRLVLHRLRPTPGTARAVADIDRRRVACFDAQRLRDGLADDEELLAELARQRPESHPSRALYGEYLVWFLDRALAVLPEHVTVVQHRTRATGVTRSAGRDVVRLADGTEVLVDAVVLAPGWLPRAPLPQDAALARAAEVDPRLVVVPPGSPIEQDLSRVPAGEPVVVRGLGMGFFDTLALLTLGRGGRFTPSPAGDGSLDYVPSGQEPVLHVTSRRGVPFRAKSLYRSLPPAPRHRYLRGEDWAARSRPLDFGRDVWPLVVRDGCTDHYETLHRVRPEAFAAPLQRVLDTVRDAADDLAGLDRALAPLVPEPADRLHLEPLMYPADRHFTSAAEYDAWVCRYVADDLVEAAKGRDSALKAGLWSIAAARRTAARLVSFGGATADSFFGAYRRFAAFGAMVGSGPPAFRSQQLLALARAGLVHFVGPGGAVALDPGTGAFRVSSPLVGGSDVASRVLVDAWLQMHDVTTTTDPVVAGLLADGRLRPQQLPLPGGGRRTTAGVDVSPDSSRLVRRDGTVDPTVHLVGVPLEDTRGDTLISPIPGSNATLLLETDGAAVSALRRLAVVTAGADGAGGRQSDEVVS